MLIFYISLKIIILICALQSISCYGCASRCNKVVANLKSVYTFIFKFELFRFGIALLHCGIGEYFSLAPVSV